MNKLRLRETLARDEGCDLKRHDVQGIDHIGYGINLEQELPDELLDYLGVEDEDDIDEITQEQADHLLDYFVDIATNDCVSIYGPEVWGSLSDLRKEVLVNLSFNLGLPRLKAFRKMNAAIKAGDWEKARFQMLDSKAAKQTGNRYNRLGMAIETDDEKHLMLTKLYDNEVPFVEGRVIGSALSDFSDADLMAELAKRLGV